MAASTGTSRAASTSRRLEPAADAVNELDIFRMQHDGDAADARGFREQVVEIAIVGPVEPEVAPFLALEVHEVLEGGDAVVAHVRLELGQVLLACGAEVETEIDVHSRRRMGQLPLEHVRVGLVVEEIADDGREAALRRVDGLGRVLRDRFGEAEMDVTVDQAGEDVQTRRIDDLACSAVAAARRQDGGDTPSRMATSARIGSVWV